MKIFGLIVAALVVTLFAYIWSRPLTVSFEATVEVDTPAGVRKGSSILAVKFDRPPFASFLPSEMSTVARSYSGETIAVEVTPGRYLFVSMGRGKVDIEPTRWMQVAYGPPDFPNGSRNANLAPWMRAMKRTSDPVVLPEGAYPPFVAFDDLADPTSIQVLDYKDMSAFFGTAASVSLMTLRVVREAPKFGRLHELLPWLTTDPINGREDPLICEATRAAGNPPRCRGFRHSHFMKKAK